MLASLGLGPEGKPAAVNIPDLGPPAPLAPVEPLPLSLAWVWGSEGPGASGTGISRKFSFSMTVRVSWPSEKLALLQGSPPPAAPPQPREELYSLRAENQKQKKKPRTHFGLSLSS